MSYFDLLIELPSSQIDGEGVVTVGENGPPPPTKVAANCTCPYAIKLTVSSRMSMPYGDKPILRRRSVSPYRDMTMLRKAWLAPYSDSLRVAARITHPYSVLDKNVVRAGMQAPYAIRTTNRGQMTAPYNIVGQCSARMVARYDLMENNPVAANNVARYMIVSDSIQSVVGLPTMTVGGEVFEVVRATMSCDEGSQFWICELELADIGNYAKLSVKDAFTLDIGAAQLSFVVDGKSFQRQINDQGGGGADVEQVPTITGISPLALADAPFSQGGDVTYFVATQARQVVEDQIGIVDWRLPDWVIPVEALAFTNSTPLSIARKIVEAIGGLIESDADGTPICRKKHPVSIPDYDTAVPDHELEDTSILSVSERIAPDSGFNRVTISNDLGRELNSTADRLDVVPTEGSLTERTVRAYLNTQRAVGLVHTGNPATVIVPLGLRRRSEVERVEFIDGQSRVQYKPEVILSMDWRENDLGAVSVSGYDLTAEIPSYSLLDVTYAVDTVDFLVQCPDTDEVQFYLVDL